MHSRPVGHHALLVEVDDAASARSLAGWAREQRVAADEVVPAGRPPADRGYPVIGVVRPEDLWQCAQLRPGDPVRFRPDATR